MVRDVEQNPEFYRAEALQLVNQADIDINPAAVALALRAAGIASRLLNELPAAIEYLQRSVNVAAGRRPARIEGQSRTSLAAALFLSGDTAAALDQLDQAKVLLRGPDRGQLWFERATIMSQLGQHVESRRMCDRALPALRRSGLAKLEASTLNTRGLAGAEVGELAAAEVDLAAARVLFDRLGHRVLAAIVAHNLGWVAARRGDYVESLRRFDRSGKQLAELGFPVGATQRDCALALLSVGLVEEATAAAGESLRAFRNAGDEISAAETILLLGSLALASDDAGGAAQFANQAKAAFAEQRRPQWQLLAELVVLTAETTTGPVASLERRALDLSSRLRRAQLHVSAVDAQLTAASIAIELGAPRRALRQLAALSPAIESSTANVRLQAAQLEADAYAASGRSDRSFDAIMRGTEIFDHAQALFGSFEISAHMTFCADRLFRTARRLARNDPDPFILLDHIELGRANALRHHRVRGEHDDILGRLLGDLRFAVSQLHSSDPAQDSENRSRIVRLEQEISAHTRQRTAAALSPHRRVSARELVEQLDGTKILTFADIDGTLVAGTLTCAGATTRELGSTATVASHAETAHRALRRLSLAGASITYRSRRDNISLLRGCLLAIDQTLSVLFGDEPMLVVIPDPAIGRVPWAGLPSLLQRPFTLAPSITSWHVSQRNAGSPTPFGFVAAPDLPFADQEIALLTEIVTPSQVLTGDNATVEQAGKLLEHNQAVHIAAHHTSRQHSPMFSSITLADGALYLHDLHENSSVPTMVVLSACDSAQTAWRPGDEPLGICPSLLSLGCSTIVAAQNLVPDSIETVAFLAAFHRAMTSGHGPAAALATARAAARVDDLPTEVNLAAGSFNCIGAGDYTQLTHA